MGRAVRAGLVVGALALALLSPARAMAATSPPAPNHQASRQTPSSPIRHAKARAAQAVSAGGTWNWQNPAPNGNSLNTVTCPTTQVCYTAGDDGPVLATTDGGAHWSQQQTETGVISLSCGDVSFCVGVTAAAGEIATSNGGTTWVSGPTGFGQLYGVSCLPSTHTCFGVGGGGMIAELSGPSVGQQNSGTTNFLFGITCSSGQCVAVGYNGTVLIDNGLQWVALPSVTTSFLITVSCGATSCVAGGIGGTAVTWPVGSPSSLTPGNIGSTADIYGSSCPQSLCMVAATDGLVHMGHGGAWGPEDVGAPGVIWSIACPSASFCLAVGDASFIAATTNGGAGWQVFQTPVAHGQFDSVSCPTTSMCLAVGFGVAKRTTDGGVTWVDLGVATNIRALACPSVAVCYLVGAKTDNTGGLVYKTTDGGNTWSSQQIASQSMLGVSCPSLTTCYTGGLGGELFATTDGTTWASQTTGTTDGITAMSCATATNCMAITQFAQNGSILATTDGSTWSSKRTLTSPLYGVKCPTITICYAVGVDANTNYIIYKTVDSGASWTHQSIVGSYPNGLLGVDCLTATNCFTIGQSGDIYGTTDGASWSIEPSPYGIWYGVSCATSTTTWCYVVDFFGSIARTNNSGLTWLRVFPNATNDDLKAISCPSTTVCFTVTRNVQSGSHGEVLSTTDGGTNWRSLFTDRGAQLDPLLGSIACPTASVCFATDSITSTGRQLVVRSSDGGATWSSVQVGTTAALTGIACPDAADCFAADAAGSFVKTTDGGATWSARALITAGGISAISCPTASRCFAADATKPGHIFMTSDGGVHWSLSFDLAADLSGGSLGSFDAIGCSSTSVCTAGGTAGLAATTTDGGVNWRTDNVGALSNLTAVSCPTDDTCYAATDDSSILRSSNWGGNWLAQFAGIRYDSRSRFAGLSCPSTTGCFAVGAAGLISTTATAGAAWTREQPVGQVTASDSISCTDSSNCYAGALGFVDPSGIQVTHDGGANWTYHMVNKADTVESISCPATNTCFASGWPGAIYFSGDGGATWTYQSNPDSGSDTTLIAISCPSAITCYAVGTSGSVLSTTNGGATWSRESSGTTKSLFGVSCAAVATCVAVGAGGTILARTGTTAWQAHASGTSSTLQAVSCPTTTSCYAVGNSGTIVATSNVGATWTAQVSGVTQNLLGIACTSSTGCLAAGNGGTVVYTLDGSTWSSTSVPTFNSLRGVAFHSPGQAWLVGFGGTILKNTNLFFLCLTTALSSDKTSPQTIGTTVTFTASTIDCNAMYEFWLLPPGGSWTVVQAYSATASYAWNTSGKAAGVYTFEVFARDAGSPGVGGTPPNTYDSFTSLQFTLSIQPCGAVTDAAVPASPSPASATVTFTASASGCPHPLYQFWILAPGGSWKIVQAFSTFATFNWNTTGLLAGTYLYTVWVRDVSSAGISCNQYGCYDALFPGTAYKLTTTPCTSVPTSASPTSPQGSGTPVTFTASAAGCPHPLYQFWILARGGSWKIGQAFSTIATFNWNTTGLPAGSYLYTVWVRDAASPGSSCNQYGCYDALFPGAAYKLTTTPCTSVPTSASPASAQGSGTPVTFTAVASGCPDPLYQFWIRAPGGSWTIVQAFSTTGTFNWNTTGLPAGTYLYTVWVRDSGSAGTSCNQYGCYDALFPGTAYALTTTPCTSVSTSASPASPQGSGTPVTFTAVASGCPHPLYQFWIRAPGGSWTIVQAFSTTATFNWNTTGLPAGGYLYTVWVRDSGSAGTTCNQYGCYDALFPGTAYSLT